MTEAAAPHPVLRDYYADAGERRDFVRALFNRTAPDYEHIDRIFSLGSGARYRREALLRAGLAPGMRVLDIAVGTGLLARAATGIVGARGSVIGVDLSEAMLAEARRKPGLLLVQAHAEHLPLAERCADFLTMGYALRHMESLATTFREFARVLRPGGRLLILEFVTPATRFGQAAARLYLGTLIPSLSRCLASGRQAHLLMDYCWNTVEHCVPPRTILNALRLAGFGWIKATRTFGCLIAYSARLPEQPAA